MKRRDSRKGELKVLCSNLVQALEKRYRRPKHCGKNLDEVCFTPVRKNNLHTLKAEDGAENMQPTDSEFSPRQIATWEQQTIL